MTSVEVFTDTQNKVLQLKSAANTPAGQTATITVSANDGQGGTATKTFTVTTAADTTDNQPFLQPIAPIMLKANTTVEVSIPWTDVDGGSPPHFELVPSDDPNLQVNINNTTGLLTVTSTNGLAGVKSVFLGVRDATSGFDTQEVPIYISPAAPAIPDLQLQSDTGTSTTDNITRLDNSDQANRLTFLITGLRSQAEVQLFDGTTLIGSGTVAAGSTSITITTNGTFDLTDGQHSITVKQTLAGQTVDVGNFGAVVDLPSDLSQPLSITVDTIPPTITSTAITTADVGISYTV